MKVDFLRLFCASLTLTAALILGLSIPAFGQGADGLVLQGVATGSVQNGKPVLRVTGGAHGTTDIWYTERDGERVFAFHVWRHRRGDGWLYVTKTKAVFVPDADKRNFLNIPRGDFKEMKLVDEWVGGGNAILLARLQTPAEKYLFQVKFTADYAADGNKKYARPATLFLLKALGDFDGAVKEFNVFTGEAVQKYEDSRKEREEEAPTVSDRYDRFKDLTFIYTSKMLLRGERRSVRVSAEYGFPGKTQKKSEKVSFYLHASAAGPVFREDDLSIVFLVDSKRLPAGRMKIADEEKTAATVRQTVAVELPYDTFAEIANGKTVEFQAGKLEYKMSDIQLETFRKLLAYKVGE